MVIQTLCFGPPDSASKGRSIGSDMFTTPTESENYPFKHDMPLSLNGLTPMRVTHRSLKLNPSDSALNVRFATPAKSSN